MHPTNFDEMVAVKSYMDEISAELAKQYLESQGIEAFVFKDDSGMIGLQRTASLMVEKYNLEKTLKLLEAMEFE